MKTLRSTEGSITSEKGSRPGKGKGRKKFGEPETKRNKEEQERSSRGGRNRYACRLKVRLQGKEKKEPGWNIFKKKGWKELRLKQPRPRHSRQQQEGKETG